MLCSHKPNAATNRCVVATQGPQGYVSALSQLKSLQRSVAHRFHASRPTLTDSSGCHHFTAPSRHFTITQPTSTSTVAQKKRKHQDPYALAQARARRAANLSRQETLKTERAKALGDPVRGITTPFIESFDTAVAPPPQQSYVDGEAATSETSTQTPAEADLKHLNHFVSPESLKASLENSRRLTAPLTPLDPNLSDSDVLDQENQRFEAADANATVALERIVSIENSNAKEKKLVNIQRCIDTFGRHNTVKFLKPPLRGVSTSSQHAAEGAQRALVGRVQAKGLAQDGSMDERAGPDTGSSEVQIAILTAKIRSLANFLEGPGRKDKMNKRNLRLLVHRRQKLLRYFHRKDRGGDRWRFLTKTLGLTDGTWKGEISM